MSREVDRALKVAGGAGDRAPLLHPVTAAIVAPKFLGRRHVNVVCASLARGGAERPIIDMVPVWEAGGHTSKIIVFSNFKPAYELKASQLTAVASLHTYERAERPEVAAQEIIGSPQMFAYTILIRHADLATFWRHGIATAPVIVNSREAWQDDPAVYNRDSVPFVVAVSSHVASELRAARLKRPIHVLRHEVLPRPLDETYKSNRKQIRSQYGIADDCLLIGMVGQFKAQKAYPRAVRVLHAVQHRRSAKLMIVGGWHHEFGFGRQTYEATMRQALQLGCIGDLLLPGNVADTAPYYCAFDVFLNTSIYEGLSIATLEAQAHGCRVVTADAGGQREVLRPNDALIERGADPDDYAAAILALPDRKQSVSPESNGQRRRSIVPELWQYLAATASIRAPRRALRAKTLFVTANLNLGGAQRSLVNLLGALGPEAVYLAVLNHLTFGAFHASLKQAGIPTTFFGLNRTYEDRVYELLAFIRSIGIANVVLWNVDPPTKLLLVKCCMHTKIRLIDVSPGPMLFRELDQCGEFQQKIAFSGIDYFHRLDAFVSKYQGGFPPERYAFPRSRYIVIRNGIDSDFYARDADAPDAAAVGFKILTVTRIVPNKQIELLIDMMRCLRARVDDATLTIVGGVEQRHVGYWETLKQRIGAQDRDAIEFVGTAADVRPFLWGHRVFVMMSKEQGCPNASLEAMAGGLPVVANDDGGTAEQILHGETGFLVRNDDPAEMARYVGRLLRDPRLAKRMGKAARERARVAFGIERMAGEYRRVLGW
jgi:glycosyltransferase involved in cell wall biosynthesis